MKSEQNKTIIKLGLYLFVAVLLWICLISCGRDINSLKSRSDEERTKEWHQALKDYSLPNDATRLQHCFTFPNEDLAPTDVFLWNASNMCTDDSENIYISDSEYSRILKFSSKGEFKAAISTRGRAPGQLLNPINVSSGGSAELLVYDSGNHRFQILDSKGDYKSSFKIFKNYSDICMNKTGLIFTSMYNPFFKIGDPLIEVMNQNGKVIRSFGQQIQVRSTFINTVKLSLSPSGEIYAAWRYLPFVRKYTQSGELLAEYRINSAIVNDIYDFNLKSGKKRKTNLYKVLMRAMVSSKNGFYILRDYPYLEITEFDDSTKIMKIYWAPSSGFNYIAADFAVLGTAEDRLFFVLQNYPKNEVNVYTIK